MEVKRGSSLPVQASALGLALLLALVPNGMVSAHTVTAPLLAVFWMLLSILTLVGFGVSLWCAASCLFVFRHVVWVVAVRSRVSWGRMIQLPLVAEWKLWVVERCWEIVRAYLNVLAFVTPANKLKTSGVMRLLLVSALG